MSQCDESSPKVGQKGKWSHEYHLSDRLAPTQKVEPVVRQNFGNGKAVITLPHIVSYTQYTVQLSL